MKLNLKLSFLFPFATASFLFSATSVQAINLSLNPSDFTVNKGIGTNSASATSALNTNPFSNGSGFENHFSSDFLILGANPNSPNYDTDIRTDSLRDENSRAISTTFTISPSDVTQDTQISFKWAFNGNAPGGSGTQDNFQLYLVNATSGANNNFFSQDRSNVSYSKENLQTVTIPANSFASGNYFLRVNVNENDDPDNKSSAAGFSNFQVQTVPFEFSPSQGLLLVGGIWGLSSFLKRKKAIHFN
jgi:hypothetical protein